jgi:hypothetical protein
MTPAPSPEPSQEKHRFAPWENAHKIAGGLLGCGEPLHFTHIATGHEMLGPDCKASLCGAARPPSHTKVTCGSCVDGRPAGVFAELDFISGQSWASVNVGKTAPKHSRTHRFTLMGSLTSRMLGSHGLRFLISTSSSPMQWNLNTWKDSRNFSVILVIWVLKGAKCNTRKFLSPFMYRLNSVNGDLANWARPMMGHLYGKCTALSSLSLGGWPWARGPSVLVHHGVLCLEGSLR